MIKRCNALLRKDSLSYGLFPLRARAYNMIDEHTKALQDAMDGGRAADAAVQRASTVQGGIAWYGLGKLDSAEFWLKRALADGPDPQASFHLGLVEKSKGDLDAALAFFQSSLDDEADQVAALRERGSVLALQGDTLGARRDLDRIVELDPRDPVNWNSRGYYSYALFNDHARAIADYDQAIKLNPNYGYAFNNRGWSYYKLGNTDKAIKDIRAAGSKNPGNPYVYRNLGVIALEEQDTKGACLQFAEAIRYGFTALHGPEVEELMRTHCPDAPVLVPEKNGSTPAMQPVPERGNAPGGRTPNRTNAP